MLNTEHKSALILIFTTILAAFGWIFSKEAIQGLPPFAFIGFRFLLASLCLLPFCYKPLFKAKLKDIASAAMVGCLLAGAIMNWIYAISISDTLGEGAFIVSLSMLIVPLVGWLLFKERPQRAFWVSLPVAMIGLAFLSLSGSWQQSSSQFFFIGCATMLALHFNVNRKYAQTLPVLLLTTIQLFVVGCLVTLFSLLTEDFPSVIAPSIWGWFALSVVLATSLRYVMQTLGQKSTPAATAALIMILEPVWTVILSILWYGEQLSLGKLIGCGFILLALILYRTQGRLFNVFKRA
ncbi:DMT family transporter [Vibrio sp. 10N.261.55.A7]|uniref:DMT family transporter n=1 Tax=Vibrio sp. 10N.261.55.A7 TaxID=1880851 RepID=UPI000C831B81|nr:DMT family transporter [Vibrio sp. 10N.261.55.A7]